MFHFKDQSSSYCVVDVSDLIAILIKSGIFKFCNSNFTVQDWIYHLSDVIVNDFDFSEERINDIKASGVNIDVENDWMTLDCYLAVVMSYFDNIKEQLERSESIPRIYSVYQVIHFPDSFSAVVSYS